MFEKAIYAISLIRDAVRQKAIIVLIHDYVYFSRAILIVTLDLTTLEEQSDPFPNSDYQFIELNYEDLRTKKLTFLTPSRYFKAMHKFKRGMRGFALIENSIILGDIWCNAPKDRNTPIRHKDLDLFGIPYTDGDVYSFDMFVDPAYRKKNLATPIHLSLLLLLKREGWKRIYAWINEDNLASRWVHYRLKFQTLQKFRANQFFGYRRIYNYFQEHPSF